MQPFFFSEIFIYLLPFVMAFIILKFFPNTTFDGQYIYLTKADVIFPITIVCLHFLSLFCFGFSWLWYWLLMTSIIALVLFFVFHYQSVTEDWQNLFRKTLTISEMICFLMYIILIVIRLYQVIF